MQRSGPGEDVPEHTMFVIITDGYENASHRYDSDRVMAMIENQKETVGSSCSSGQISTQSKPQSISA